MTLGRIITCDGDVSEGAAWLSENDPAMARAYAATGPLPLRLRADGFEALVGAIIGQQVSVASAAALQARMQAAGLMGADHVRRADDEALRGVGLSRPKVRYVRALAEADLDYAELRQLPDHDVLDQLTAVTGIGMWTAQIYAMFSLGRADVFAPGDLALQEAVRVLYGLEARPKPAALDTMAHRWSPWRSVAARMLFAYYRVIKQREGLG